MIRPSIILTITSTLLPLACNGDDGGGVTTDVAMTTAIDTTSRGEATATSTDSDTSTSSSSSSTSSTTAEETTGAMGDDPACVRLAWLHPNPPIIPGGGGSEFYRTIGVDMTKCSEKHEVSLAIAPVGDNALVLALGAREPGCILVGAPAAEGVESLGFPLGASVEWTAVAVVVFLDGEVHSTINLPEMVAEEDKMGDLGPRAYFEDGGLWYLAPVGELPHC